MELIKQDKSSEEIIKPLLRGADIKKYNYSYKNQYIIFTRKGIDIEKYPAIKKYLNKFYNELLPKKNTSEKIGRKPGKYQWYEIQDNTAYYEEFEKDKVIWIEISDKANYCYDLNKNFLTNSAYFISGKNLKFILGLLNSKVCDFYFSKTTVQIAGGRKRYTKQYVEQIPIPKIPKEDQQSIIDSVNQILSAKKENPKADTSQLENEIDKLVYQLYNLTPEEIKIIEDSVK